MLAGMVSLGFAVVAPLIGQPVMMAFPFEDAIGREPTRIMVNIGIVYRTDLAGELTFEGSSAVTVMLHLAGILGFLVTALSAIGVLRILVDQVGHGRPFDGMIGTRLIRSGFLLCAYPFYTLALSTAWHFYLLNLDERLDKGFASWLDVAFGRTDGSAVLLPEFQPWLIVIGTVLVIIGRASRTGAAIQQDSDEIV